MTNNKNKITSYINKNFYQEGFYYHSFNSGLLNVIKKKGLNASNKLSLFKEIENVKQIFNQAGFYSLLGFIDSYHKREIYLSANFQTLYKYALSSPEWFDHFTCRSLNHLLNPNVYEEAFYNREYKKAKSNIISLIANINNKKIIALNELWTRKIKRKVFNLEKLLNYCLQEYKQKYKSSKKHIAINFEAIIKNKNSCFVKIDNKKFSNKERLFIYMETYDNFNRKLKNQKICNKINDDNQRKIIKLFDRFWKVFGQKKYNSFLIKRSHIRKNKKVNYNKLFLENEWDITHDKPIQYSDLLLLNLPNINLKKISNFNK